MMALIQHFKKFYSRFITFCCVLCGNLSEGPIDLCLPCQNSLPIIPELWKITASGAMIIPYHYEYPLTHLIQNLKFQETLIYAKILGELFARKLSIYYQNNPLPEMIIPVPLHKKRLKERGFNQALEIAKPIAKHFKVPINTLPKRIKSTKPQATLSAEHRMKNLQDAFHIPSHFSAKHVAILDDVITTGFTIQAFVLALKNAGVAKIDVWCVARATPLVVTNA